MLTQSERRLFRAEEDRREAAETGPAPKRHRKSRLCTLCLSGEEPDRCAYCDAVEVAEHGDYCSDICAELDAKDDADDRAMEACQ